jgi:serine/threonine-protein kinase
LASALAAIHAAGIVHRDLKPQNIMLVERPGLEELVKVLDFGIASIKSTDEEKQEVHDMELTGARMVLGTPPYMSPEQTYMRADRERLGVEVDARSDLYALGIILYEMAAGRRPFNGDAHEIVIAHRHVKPMPLERMVGVVVPRAFADLVNQCLAKEPRERPASAVELVAALKACVGLPVRRWLSEPDPCELGTESAMVALPAGMSASRSPVEDGGEPKAARVRRVTWMIAVVALAVGGGAFFVQRMAAAPGGRRAEARPVDIASNGGPGVAAAEGVATDETAAVGAAAVVAKPALERAAGPAAALPVEAAMPSVGVMVASDPAGASVLIDGVPRGGTPVTIPVDAPQAGRIEVLLRKERHQDTKVMLAIGPELGGKVLVVNQTLAKLHKPVTLGAGVVKPEAAPPALTTNNGPGADPFKDL